MAQFPSLPLFTDAYLGDTTHLTTFEHGAYLLLLIAQWRSKDDCLPNDDVRLARIAGTTVNHWRKIKPTIFEFFSVSDEVIIQNRLRDERTWVAEKSQINSSNSKARWLKIKETNNTGAPQPDIRNECEPDTPTPTPTPTPTKYTVDFEIWWKEYPSSKGKSPAQIAYKKALKKIDKEELLQKTKEFKKSLNGADKKFTPHATSWLNQELWLDELETKERASKGW